MAYERASVFEVPILSPESLVLPGTAVTPDTKLEAIGFKPRPRIETSRFRPEGYKVDTLVIPGKEWSEFRVAGRGDYRNIVYPLSSILTAPVITVPGGGTLSRDWVFTPQATSFDALQTYTGIVGSPVRAEQYNGIQFTELGMVFSRDSVEISGAAMGRRMQDPVYLPDNEVKTLDFAGTISGGTFTVTVNAVTTAANAWNITADNLQLVLQNLSTVGPGNVIVTGGPGPADFVLVFCGQLAGTGPTVTASGASLTGGGTLTVVATQADIAVTQLAAEVIIPATVNIFADDAYANFGTTKLLRVLRAELRLASRWNPLWVMNSTETSYVAAVEIPLDLTLKIKVAADSVGLAGFLTNIRAGSTKYVRIESVSSTFIEAAIPWMFRCDFPGKVEMADDMGSDDITSIDWTFRAVQDSGWTHFIRTTVTNNLTGL